jgi:hypothetical protein
VNEFVRIIPGLNPRGSLWVEQQASSPDLNVAVLLDRDLFEALPFEAPSVSVGLEEVSHFVYLNYNHERGRNITRLEMEIQAEVDRIVLAFDPRLGVAPSMADSFWEDLHQKSFEDSRYETARLAASRFLKSLKYHDPRSWTPAEFQSIERFYELSLQDKLKR